MAFIESHQSLRDHPKRRKLSRLLGIDRAETIGRLHLLWWYCLDYAEDGSLAAFDDAEIADAADWPITDAARFVSALSDAGFLDVDDQGSYVVHDWWTYAGRLIAKREQNRDRARAYRERHKDRGDTSSLRTRDVRVTQPLRTDATNQPTVTNQPSRSLSDDKDSSATESPTRRQPKKRVYAEGSIERETAEQLAGLIRRNNPSAKPPTDAILQAWADTVRLMIERDGRTIEDIRAVIRFSQDDTFWRGTVLSMDAIRRQYDRLTMQRQRPTNGRAVAPDTSTETIAARKAAADAQREYARMQRKQQSEAMGDNAAQTRDVGLSGANGGTQVG